MSPPPSCLWHPLITWEPHLPSSLISISTCSLCSPYIGWLTLNWNAFLLWKRFYFIRFSFLAKVHKTRVIYLVMWYRQHLISMSSPGLYLICHNALSACVFPNLELCSEMCMALYSRFKIPSSFSQLVQNLSMLASKVLTEPYGVRIKSLV